ncbi:uncharacterized protein rbbp8l isoform X2 [Hippocampus zosterae]|uniref:uncharacterized protein rbbp8l isoform X2 n=1 Tax=Hippocampus zosterae TaxID=109293 RepID=UPI00223E2491|nr:uncharacterized protein rbbp8l isoform X2 [Hippocampus zosterae]
MESFNELLLKLREVHERELEGWQMKVQELSNKKGCDTKRMEELFTKNQQMKEQQRILTENIKTLENSFHSFNSSSFVILCSCDATRRLRAGLCDRCTVTQEVAKRRQQEFEVSQMQTIQHITLLAGETNALKKENRRLRDEIDHLREALSHTPLEAKPNTSPDLSPLSGPVSLITMATGRATSDQPVDGNVAVKTDTNQMADEPPSEFRQLQAISKSHFALSTFTSQPWKTESSVTHGDRRSHAVGAPDQAPPVPSQALHLRTTNADVNPTRHTIKAPVPCRPQPIKSSPVPFPWALPESSAWASLANSGTNLARHPYPKSNLPRFPNLVPSGQHTSLSSIQDQVYGTQWHKNSSFQGPIKEPIVVFRLNNLSEHTGILGKSQEKRDTQPSTTERVSGDGLRDLGDGPLDLSDRGKSKPSQTTKHEPSLFSQEGEGVNKRTDKELMQSLPTPGQTASPPSSRSLAPSLPLVTQQQDVTQHKQKVVKENAEQKKEADEKTEQSNGKKVPGLTISLRPVVVLESMNSAIQMQDGLSTNGKSSPPAVEPKNSEEQVEEREEDEEEVEEEAAAEDEEEENVSEQANNHAYKRKKLFVDTEMDQDSDTDAKAKKVKITVRAPEKNSS